MSAPGDPSGHRVESRDADALYRSLFANNPDAVYATDLDARLTRVNLGAERMTGYSQTELIGRDLASLIAPEDRQRLAEEVRHVLAGEAQHLEVALLHKSGHRVAVRCTKLPIIEDGQVVGMFGLAVDLTEQRRTAMETNLLARAGERLAASLDASRTLLTAVHLPVPDMADGCAIDLLAHDRLQRAAAAHVTPAREVTLAAAPDRILRDAGDVATRVVQHHEVVLLADARPVLDALSAIAVPLISHDEVIGIFWLLTGSESERRYDATDIPLARALADRVAVAIQNTQLFATARREAGERQRAEEELRHAQKMDAIGRLAGGIAHDFNNLLAVISGNATLALDSLDRGRAARQEVEEIARAADHAAALTRQLLAFSRKQPVQPTVLSLNDAVQRMEKMLARLLGAEIRLVTHLADDLQPVLADRTHLEQILLNLATNARDAMPDGGELTIETGNVQLPTTESSSHRENALPDVPPGDYARLRVRDTGRGMSAEVQSRIFEPFFTTKDTGKGTGLGLATVYGIVLQADGHITVRSAPGEGTEITVLLPALDMPVVPRMPASAAPRRHVPEEVALSAHGVILVADDQEAARQVVARILRSAGYEVITAANGREALDRFAERSHDIDVVITDSVMPVMGGAELARQLGAVAPHVPIVMMSGYPEQMADVSSARPLFFLQKPFGHDELLDLMRRAREAHARRTRHPSPPTAAPEERAR